MFYATIQNYSYLFFAFARAEAILSILGFVLVAGVCWIWRGGSPKTLLSVWLIYWVWLAFGWIAGPLHEWTGGLLSHWGQPLLPSEWFSPCTLPHVSRLDEPFFDRWPLLNWYSFVLLLWASVAAFRAAHMLRQRTFFWRIVNSAKLVEDPQFQVSIDRWLGLYQFRRSVRVVHSGDFNSAFTIGVFRPVVFLPDHFLTHLSQSDIDAVIGHEITHIKRLDDLYLIIQMWVRAVFFFNILLIHNSKTLTGLRESSCDISTIENGGLNKKRYVSALLNILELTRDYPQKTSSLVSSISGNELKQRIGKILKSNQAYSPKPALISFALLIGLSITSLMISDSNRVLDKKASQAALAEIEYASPVPQGVWIKGLSSHQRISCSMPFPGIHHPGADIRLPYSPDGFMDVHSIADGTVVSVVHLFSVGSQALTIDHGRHVKSYYIYADDIIVSVGDRVQKGQVVARVTNKSVKQKLHFELRYREQVINPIDIFDATTPVAQL